MVDTVNGKIRARSWPRRRPGKGTTEQQQNRAKFAEAQRSARYVAPEMLAYIIKATENSPLLPRDILTMQAYNRWAAFDLDDGRTLWPMPARTDVSETLDVLGTTPGYILVRGNTFWEAVPFDPGEPEDALTPPRLVDFPILISSPDGLETETGVTIGGAPAGQQLRAYLQPIPDSQFSVTIRVTGDYGSTFNGTGIVARSTAGEFYLAGVLNAFETLAELSRWPNANFFSTGLAVRPMGSSNFPEWLRITYEPISATFAMAVAWDGLNWLDIGQSIALGPIDAIGFGNSYRNNVRPTWTAFSHWHLEAI